MSLDQTPQLASAAYTIATNNASLTLELALRGAAKDQDDAAAADGKATSSAARTARKTWERALSGGALQLAQKGITTGSQREADQANAMEAFSNSLATTFNTTFGTGSTSSNTGGTSTAGSGWGALGTLATASGTWLSTMLGLVQGRGEKEQDAAEKRDTRKADAQESLVGGIVSGIVGWLNENATARTVFANASVTISTAYDITVRTAGGAYSKRKIDDAKDAAIANSERIKSENAARAQAAIDAIETKSLNDEWNEPSDTMLLQMQYHASDLDADMATQKQSYLDQNGIPALKAWVAEVDASGVLDEEETTEPNPDPNNPNPTGAQGGAPQGSGVGSNSSSGSGNSGTQKSPWEQALDDLNAKISALNSLDLSNISDADIDPDIADLAGVTLPTSNPAPEGSTPPESGATGGGSTTGGSTSGAPAGGAGINGETDQTGGGGGDLANPAEVERERKRAEFERVKAAMQQEYERAAAVAAGKASASGDKLSEIVNGGSKKTALSLQDFVRPSSSIDLSLMEQMQLQGIDTSGFGGTGPGGQSNSNLTQGVIVLVANIALDMVPVVGTIKGASNSSRVGRTAGSDPRCRTSSGD